MFTSRSMSHLPEVNSADPVSADLLQQEYLGPLMQHSAESAVVFLRNKVHVVKVKLVSKMFEKKTHF